MVLGSSAGEAATATFTSVSNAALLLLLLDWGQEAIMDFNEGVPPGLLAVPGGSLVRV